MKYLSLIFLSFLIVGCYSNRPESDAYYEEELAKAEWAYQWCKNELQTRAHSRYTLELLFKRMKECKKLAGCQGQEKGEVSYVEEEKTATYPDYETGKPTSYSYSDGGLFCVVGKEKYELEELSLALKLCKQKCAKECDKS